MDSLTKLKAELIPYFAMIPNTYNDDDEGASVREEAKTDQNTKWETVSNVT